MCSYKKDYKSFLKTVKCIFLLNWKILLSYTLLYKIIEQLIVLPSIKYLIDLSYQIEGYEFLNTTVFIEWITKPITLPILIACIFILGFYVMFEISAIILYVDYGRNNIKITCKNFYIKSIKRAIRVLLPKNWGFLILVLLLFPFTYLLFSPTIISGLHIPEFIMNFINSNITLYILYFGVIIILNILGFILIFSLPAFILDLKSFKESIRTSRKLIKTHLKYTFSYYIKSIILMLIISLLIFAVLLSLILFAVKFFVNPHNASNIFLDCYILFKGYSSFFFSIFSVIFNFIFITVMYLKIENKSFIPILKIKNLKRRIIITLLQILIILPMIGIYIDTFQPIPINIATPSDVKIVAHRAGSLWAPENTLIALEKAIEDKSYYAEIDVQQTKDKKLVILHDTNLNRVAGINKNIWDMNYDEVKNLDAGSHFSYKYKGEKIPTLSQMIKKANNKIKLMIEIKKNGHEKNIEHQVVDEIKSHNFEKQCVIASMDLNVLKTIKNITPEIDTVYITPAIYGDYYSLKYIDAFSIEATFINRETIILAHEYNKKVYLWTVNKEHSLINAFNLKVDGVITDNPPYANFFKNLDIRDMLAKDLIDDFF